MVQKTSNFRRICSSDVFITLVVCSAIFSDSFVYDLIIPFIPQMLERRLGLPRDQVQLWTSTLLAVFGGAFALGNVLAGFLTDRSTSAKFPFLLGMVTMIASSLMFFLGQHIAVTVSARALQGVSASFVWVSGLAYLNSQIKSNFIGTAMGYISVGMAAGEVLGPIVGGVMYEHAGHFAVLFLVCGILGVDIILRCLLVDKKATSKTPDHQTDTSNHDTEDQPLLHEQEHPSSSTTTSTSSSSTAVTDPHPTTPSPKTIQILNVTLDQDLLASFYAATIIGTIRYSFESALSIFVIQHFNWSTSASGGILFAFLSPAILGPWIGNYTTYHGPRQSSIILFSVATFSLIILGFLTHSTTTTKIFFVVVITVIGICISSLITIQSIAFSVAAKRREIHALKQAAADGDDNGKPKTSTGTAFGGFSMAWTVGMFVGPLAAEILIDRVNWLSFCFFLAALSAVSAFVMRFTWKVWEVPNDNEEEE